MIRLSFHQTSAQTRPLLCNGRTRGGKKRPTFICALSQGHRCGLGPACFSLWKIKADLRRNIDKTDSI